MLSSQKAVPAILRQGKQVNDIFTKNLEIEARRPSTMLSPRAEGASVEVVPLKDFERLTKQPIKITDNYWRANRPNKIYFR